MHDSSPSALSSDFVDSSQNYPVTPLLQPVLVQALATDFSEQAASFGRWWFHVDSGQLVLSANAAIMLGVEAGWYPALESCFVHVLSDDLPLLRAALQAATTGGQSIENEFRVIRKIDGMRWFRLLSSPQLSGQQILRSGLLMEMTASRHAAIRERLSFETTQFLLSTDTLGTAVTKVIKLVCENLGWEWGAYWGLESDQAQSAALICKNYWHDPAYPLDAFTEESCRERMEAGVGAIGKVWQNGEASWIENMEATPGFLRSKDAAKSGLQSGYVFPVVYVTEGGQRHSPGVLEFYSKLARQREAQLPFLSATIGVLIAQTAQRLEQEETIRHLAQIDGLTELANRTYFYRLLDNTCEESTVAGKSFGLIFIDLDRFKPVNDAFGHEAGNVVLHEFAQRLQALVPAGSYVGRLGGDEFAILLIPGLSTLPLGDMLSTVAGDVLTAARTPFKFDGNDMTVSASVGISVFPDNGVSSPELLRSADAAMYRIKKSGRNALSFFSNSTSHTLAAQQSDVAQRMTMEAELRQALVDNAFFLEYQPIFQGDEHHMQSVEALIRWRRASGEVVRPDIFIPIAEQSALIVNIGRWVLRQACHDLAHLHRAGFSDLQMHVNMAAPEFTSTDLPDELSVVLDEFGIATHHLCLELTEGMLMHQPDKVIPVMRALRELGVGISLDDFGVGYSSLARLKRLPISSIKIDRSFVHGLPDLTEDRAIVRAMIELGRHMNLSVIAEGVETEEQLTFLRQHGCSLIQGFILSRPVPLDVLIASYNPLE
ncbi:putative bifunctional diguanylate cyclase/phosphodiesterase [Glaciimonas immobilis]|uniref:Diguanylate cyclase (GGDEF)-like protein n=1 Tax=Glaciimonas immobilis TaxID=728004 RepID=A0A840RTX9_9BURK|nr:GGDEF domain-containing phosphodiesterase [Glaciimonas immobilis]KAF3996387.1 EAL domain-containing protein [Glaciimonas immobilis]MBB5201285.1 diguanylate cyclase (GGDEF)-like protein [Glaciimonas immobilis]